MASDPKNPVVGEIHIDATACLPYAVDLPPGGTAGMLPEQQGIAEAIGEVTANQAAWGPKAGITAEDLATVMNAHAKVEEIDHYLPAARKMVEILEETRAQQVDIRERGLRAIAHIVDGRGRLQGDTELLAKYEKTRAYRSITAMKGVKTRAAKAKKAAQAGQNGPAGPSGG
jgi:hypothetical protein